MECEIYSPILVSFWRDQRVHGSYDQVIGKLGRTKVLNWPKQHIKA